MKVNALFVFFVAVFIVLSIGNVAVADGEAMQSLDALASKTFVGTYSGQMKSMGLKLVVLSTQGKEGIGKITFSPHSIADRARLGEFDASLHLLDDGKIRVHFRRPAADGADGHSYIFTVKEGGNKLESSRGGVLEAK